MLREKIDNDLRIALKNKEKVKVSAPRFLKASLQNAKIAKREELADEDIIAIIKKQLKQREESIGEFNPPSRSPRFAGEAGNSPPVRVGMDSERNSASARFFRLYIERRWARPRTAIAVRAPRRSEKQESTGVSPWSFKKGNRQDLVDKETEELKILQGYMPEEISPQELLGIVTEAINETKAASPKDMGRVIKEVMARAKGRADGKSVSDMVREKLSKSEKQ